ncbi:MAG: peptide chain release factor N(5)-glutamine methyltransferase [Acidimicrobiaceae bacterium]|nr:peptide chain release factor N(5)-glutamine methyltransferase [Acidimicrobiaceae bacterium]
MACGSAESELVRKISALLGSQQLAQWIVAEANDRERGGSPEKVAFEIADRYIAGEPLQYIFGHWSFRTLELKCDSRALIPRPETELLVELVKSEIASNPAIKKVLEIGTGTGAIALALGTELSGLYIIATEVSSAALELARENLAAQENLLSEVEMVFSDLFSSLSRHETFDLIVSNPPYVSGSTPLDPIVANFEPHTALFGGEDGLSVIREIIRAAPEKLKGPGSHVMIEIGESHGPEVTGMATHNGFSHVRILPDLSGRDRFADLVY